MNNWYVLRVKFEMWEGVPDEYFYESIEWTDPEPPREDVGIEFDNGDGFEAGTFTVIAGPMPEADADAYVARIEAAAKSIS